MNKTPRTSAALKACSYKTTDADHIPCIAYDIGKFKGEMQKLERETITQVERIADLERQLAWATQVANHQCELVVDLQAIADAAAAIVGGWHRFYGATTAECNALKDVVYNLSKTKK